MIPRVADEQFLTAAGYAKWSKRRSHVDTLGEFPKADGRPFSMESDDVGNAPNEDVHERGQRAQRTSRCKRAADSEDAFEAGSAAAAEHIFDCFRTREVRRTARRVMEREMSPRHR
jgi:hypothetical protein